MVHGQENIADTTIPVTFHTFDDTTFTLELSPTSIGQYNADYLRNHTPDNVTLEREAKDLSIYNENGQYRFEGTLEEGYAIEDHYLSFLISQIPQNTSYNGLDIKIPYSIDTPRPYLISGDSKTPLDVISQGVSDYAGSSQSRIYNIDTALANFNGISIAPGEDFSFNDHLGPVDASTGYKMELVIKGPKTVPDYGGGVCQVSSTVFRAALQAGLPILERKPHSYAVSYYTPWGTDATIYPGVVDLKFTNDFKTPLIVQGYREGSELHINFYGTQDKRKVLLIGPQIYGQMGAPNPTVETVDTLPPGKRVWKEHGHNGFHASWERVITTVDGTHSETFDSTYEARGGYVLEGAVAKQTEPESSSEESNS